jgi:hypothetical protein
VDVLKAYFTDFQLYMVDLDENVDEVKKQIRHAEDPDYEDLLEQEKEGKDRKTIKEFLQHKIETAEEETEEEVEEELVEEIEEETEGGILSDFNSVQVLGGGVMVGLLLGLIVGAVAFPMNGGISNQQAADRAEALFTASGQYSADQIDVTAEPQNNMYYINVTTQTTGPNGTSREGSQGFYMTTDGEALFYESIPTALGQRRPVRIDIDRALQRAQQPQEPEQPANGTETQTGNTTQ